MLSWISLEMVFRQHMAYGRIWLATLLAFNQKLDSNDDSVFLISEHLPVRPNV